jgi:hypothetical protein
MRIARGGTDVRVAASILVLATVNTAGCKERNVSPPPPAPEPLASGPVASSPLPGAEPPSRPANADEALVIFPAEQARELHEPQADDYFTPSTEDVRAAANAIASHLKKHAASSDLDSSDEWFGSPPENALGEYLQDGARFILPRLVTYWAQFAGVVRHGRKMVAANYLCEFDPAEKASYWLRRRWYQVDDGGACYFQFFYDPQDRSIHDLALNGDA